MAAWIFSPGSAAWDIPEARSVDQSSLASEVFFRSK